MKRITLVLFTLFIFIFGVSTAQANGTAFGLWEWAINQNGTIFGEQAGSGPYGTIPSNVVITGFTPANPLGVATITTTVPGDHTVLGFFDYELVEEFNTFYNENGTKTGTPATGQTWEIDEPGYVFGDIYWNFGDSDNTTGSLLDNSNGVPPGSEDDVSMALGWDFTLVAGQTSVISFMVSDTAPLSGFYLTHTDPDTLDPTGAPVPTSIYLSSTNTIRGEGENPVPIPPAVLLLGSGLAGLAGLRKKFAK